MRHNVAGMNKVVNKGPNNPHDPALSYNLIELCLFVIVLTERLLAAEITCVLEFSVSGLAPVKMSKSTHVKRAVFVQDMRRSTEVVLSVSRPFFPSSL